VFVRGNSIRHDLNKEHSQQLERNVVVVVVVSVLSLSLSLSLSMVVSTSVQSDAFVSGSTKPLQAKHQPYESFFFARMGKYN
jgi:uncharacterized membrane protein AbrB (regulator of aidB expression)